MGQLEKDWEEFMACLRKVFLGLISFFLVFGGVAGTQSELEKHLSQAILGFDKSLNIGVSVRDLASNKTLYAKNEDRFFVPASVLKLFTAASALIELGPDYQFKTSLFTNAKHFDNGVLEGDLILQFSGDPTFSTDDLYTLFASLERINIKKINGNVILKMANDKAKSYPPGAMLDDLDYGFGAPVGPFALDKNQADFVVNPNANIGEDAKVTIVEKDKRSLIDINSTVSTTAQNNGCSINRSMDENNILSVKGCLPKTAVAKVKSVAIKNPEKYLQDSINKVMDNLNIRLEGQVLKANLKQMMPAKKKLMLAQIKSVSLSSLIADMLKPSDNLYADSIFLKVGKSIYKKSENFRKTGIAEKNLLNQYADLNLTKASIVDGSGLSRYNLITPKQVVSLLAFLYQQFPISYEFLTGLAVSGRDGTLYKRHVNTDGAFLIRAKTGSMTGVTSLAGFLPSKNGHPLAFSIMINGIPQGAWGVAKYRMLEDNIAKILLSQNVKTPLLLKSNKAISVTKMPFANRLNASRAIDEKERLSRRFEASLRKILSQLPIQVMRDGKYLSVYPVGKNIDELAVMAKVNKVVNAHKAVGLYSARNLSENLRNGSQSRLIIGQNDKQDDKFYYLLWK